MLAVLLTCLSLVAHDQGSAITRAQGSGLPPHLGPKIQFDSTAFDFGKVDSGQLVKHFFVFTNAGSAVLEITNIRSSCGCATTKEWDRRVDPGNTGTISVEFDSRNLSGLILRTLHVECNDPLETNLVLQIMGTLWHPIEVTPMTATFVATSESWTNQTQVLRILNQMEESVSFAECTYGEAQEIPHLNPGALTDTPSTTHASNRVFAAALKTIRPGREFELRVTVTPPFLSDYIEVPITIKTTSPRVPVLTINAIVIRQLPKAK